MDRRTYLSSLSAGTVAAVAGCVADGRVALEISEGVTVDPLNGWSKKLPDVEGDGALSLTIRADQRFDIYYFTSDDTFEQYKNYVYQREATTPEGEGTATATANATAANTPSSMPSGHDDVSQAAVPKSDSEKYEVQVPDDGGRKSIETTGAHYFVVDHSNYGNGVRVDRFGDPLDAFIDLKVIDKRSLL